MKYQLVLQFSGESLQAIQSAILEIRPATANDLDLLVRVDLEDEGVTPGYREGWGEAELETHRQLILSFIFDGGAWIAEKDSLPVGAVLWRIRHLEQVEPESVFREIDASIFPTDGVFAEVYQLWVDPNHRRGGIGTALKRSIEMAVRSQNVRMIYTHTEQDNAHVLALNEKLGYREVRRGLIWDEVIRVSLVKHLR
jgi:ribosomal protein S18 acetylase RimI-like enzyme